jgi:glycosyltransferase involved in cell wall biosynthesis
MIRRGAVETTPKPILFLIDELEVGGAQRQILLLGTAMKRAGHAVTVAYFQDHNAEMRPAFEAAGIDVLLLRKRRAVDPVFLVRLARTLARERDRLVLSLGYTANLWTRIAGLAVGAAAPVACIRDFGYLPRVSAAAAPALAAVERALARSSRWVVANSQVAADSVVARGCIPAGKIRVIPNAVETRPPAPRHEARSRLRALVGGAEPAPIIGTLTRLVDLKDLPTLLRAARLVVDRRPDARFVVGGEGPQRAPLEALRRELALDDRVFLPGTLGRDVIAGLDVAILTSSSEGMPNFVLEAMAAAVPVVSTRAGAAPDLLDEGALGRLAAVGDFRGVADGIAAVLDAPEAAATVAARAATKARALTPEVIAERYLALFAAPSGS